MDYDRLIEQLRDKGCEDCPHRNTCRDDDTAECVIRLNAATALSTLQAENEKLRAELERVTAERDGAVDADKAILWLKDYVFEDSRKIYTNGARIIPYFRVLQALRDKAYNGLKEDT